MALFQEELMEEEQISNMDLIAMANNFTEYRIDAKYFPLMFYSSCITESLKYIYILRRIRKLSTDDILEIKQVFQENFNFFSEQDKELSTNRKYNKKKIILLMLFFTLLICSAVGCMYSLVVFVPLVIICCICLIKCAYIINIQNCPYKRFERYEDIYESCKSELFMLKLNLNQLRNLLAEKYQIKTTNIDSVDTSSVANHTENFQKRKKSVSFAPVLNVLNIFAIESPETRSRANSYENNGNLQPKA